MEFSNKINHEQMMEFSNKINHEQMMEFSNKNCEDNT